MNSVKHTFIRTAASTFGQFETLSQFLADVATKKLVFFGETHGEKPIISLQKEVLQSMMGEHKLNVIMEHFSFEMQDLLEEYQEGKIDINELGVKYKEIGTEGHDVHAYEEVLELAR